MPRAIVYVLALVVLSAGATVLAAAEQPSQKPPQPAVQPPASSSREVRVGDLLIAQPVRCKNLTVFPVLSATPKNEDRYIILEEGLKARKVDVYEVGATPTADSRVQSQSNRQQEYEESGDVNHLMVRNRARLPLYLMPGEIILGGKQDRCVAQESIIPADGKPVMIDVYCVEHGRWTSGQQFSGKAGNLNKSGRAAVQEGKGQQEVWEKVGESNAASGARSSTGAFTANYTDPQILKRIDAYVKELEKPVAQQRHVVGAIVAVDGKIETIDVFAWTPLFEKMWPKLLKGYALDAAVGSPKKSKKNAEPPTLKDAKEFLQAAMQAEVQQKTTGKGLVVTKRDSKRLSSYSAAPRSAEGGFEKSVHSSAYAK
jgi:hypothetical protein